jgi:voltage-gated potassium channel
VLALREEDGSFNTNPSPDTTINVGHVLIAIGTPEELDALAVIMRERAVDDERA